MDIPLQVQLGVPGDNSKQAMDRKEIPYLCFVSTSENGAHFLSLERNETTGA
jgi:hypothetical protein